MRRFPRVLLAALAMLALCAPIAHGDDDDEPRVTPLAATGLTQTSAILNARIDPEDDDGAAYRFHYGPGSYSKQTGWYGFGGEATKDVSVQVTGLAANTNYQFRVEAWNDDGQTYGDKRNFTTLKTLVPSAGAPAVSTPEPALGQTVVAEASAGTVLVKEKGSSEFHPLDSAESIPVNSILDTSEGTVILETALGGGKSQSGTFHGGTFQVRQSRSGKGMTEIALRGGSFASCTQRPGSRRTVTYRKKNTIRKLWGEDNGGRFKTSGKGSVATVRGTSWYTADRCDGTLTKVESGAVMVRERGSGRSKLLRPGQSFLARIPH